MKARVPVKRALSNRTKAAVEDYIDTYEKEVTRRLLKLACVALNTEFGFGKERLQRLLQRVNAFTADEILWWHVDKLLIDRVELAFEREQEG